MPHELTIGQGATSIELTDSTVAFLMDYEPRTPDVTVQEFDPQTLRDGGELGRATRRNVTESARCILVGANGAAVQATIQTLEKFFLDAEERQRSGQRDAVYVEVQMTSDTESWVSEILTGKVTLAGDVWDLWANSQAEVVISWTRRWYWESSTTYSVAMNSQGTARTTSGVVINNHNDSGEGNYLNILAADVAGELPTPLLLKMRSDNVADTAYFNFYICHYAETHARRTLTNFVPVLEGESATNSPTITVDANSSNGNYGRKAYSTGTTSTTHRWTLTAAQLDAMNGAPYRFLARFAGTVSSSIYFTLALGWPTSGILTTFGTTPEVKSNGRRLQDLGVLRIPPFAVEETARTFGAMALELRVRAATGANLDLDFLQLSCLDGWRHIATLGYTYSQNSIFADNALLGNLYVEGAGLWYPVLVGQGTPIHVIPGVNQRIYILHDEATGVMNISRQMTVTAAYRKRRLTL